MRSRCRCLFRAAVVMTVVGCAFGLPGRAATGTLFDWIALPAPLDGYWARYAPSCDGADLISCGSAGKYRLGSVTPPVACVPQAVGVAELRPYPRTIAQGGPVFPTPPDAVLEQEFDTGYQSDSRNADGDADWVAVIDFDDDHGWSTTYLAGAVSGPDVEAVLVPLDEQESDPFGAVVNDFHVVRALCSIVEAVEQGVRPVPRAVNMSFGRVKSATESWYASDCQAGSFACQVAQLAGTLSDQGAAVVAAAGNHDEMLFPAGLPDVLAAGMLDLHALFATGDGVGVWEAPDGADVLAPGGHLCLDDGWPAPAGASYSSALAAGWFAAEPALLDGGTGPWAPVWDGALGCYVLGDGTGQRSACNAAVSAIFATLDGTAPNPCWSPPGGSAVSVSNPGGGADPPQVPGFDHWAVAIHPTPSGDPCVPCVTDPEEKALLPGVTLNLAESVGLDPSVYIVAVYLRTGDDFDLVPLPGQELAALRAGTLRRLELAGYDLDGTGTQPSLWYLLSDEPNPDCAGAGTCFWASSNILLAD